MPIYEFQCSECNSRFEKLCGISSGTEGISCPECESGNIKRLISAFFSRSSGGGSSCSCGGNCGKSSCAGCHH